MMPQTPIEPFELAEFRMSRLRFAGQRAVFEDRTLQGALARSVRQVT